MANFKQKAELEVIRQKNKGFLRPEDVVRYARSPKTALHTAFQWDDGKAAQEFRLLQARQIIRVIVTVHEQTNKNVRAFVSLRSERAGGETGYRAMVDVLSNEDLTRQLLEDAKRDLAYFSRKYSDLRDVAELEGVFTAIDALEQPRKRGKKSRQVTA